MPELLIIAGFILLVAGFIKKAGSGALAGVRRRPISHLETGVRQLVSGKVRSTQGLSAPLSGQSCVFYRKLVEERSQTPGQTLYWRPVSDEYYGAFFVEDGSGTALVVPGPCHLDFAEPPFKETDLVMTRQSEESLPAGAEACVIGVPRPFSDFVRYLQHSSGHHIPPGLVAFLLELEKDEKNAAMPCFYGEGVDRLTDRSFEACLSARAGAATLLLQAGAVALGTGIALSFM